MNIFLWILQVLLALHTLIGALWKFSNPVATLPSMAAMPQGLWLTLAVLEIICVILLLAPIFKKSLGKFVSSASLAIAAEMFLYTGFHVASGSTDNSQIVYWMVVVAICGFLAYGRTKLKPIG